MTPRAVHMVDQAEKPRRRRRIDWWRVYDDTITALLAALIAHWWVGGFIAGATAP